ncbi:unnamed protein product [Coffea canephora]|uniref:RNase H type-1 domain-containing protein n=1 Tax=Coffea canephora TaxID=49390 RepID=A0A068UVE3_COFCA|nr:unnamed protein product [Coffea canephora]
MSSVRAELKALLYGVKLALAQGYFTLHLESNALVLVQIVQGRARCPWSLQRDLQELLQARSFFKEVSHCFRDANKPDRLSNVGVDSGVLQCMSCFVICLDRSALCLLIRLDKPIGTFRFAWPCMRSLAFAVNPGSLPVVKMLAFFFLVSFLSRNIACTINDYFDKDFDAQVERTKGRPLASGTITGFQALCFLGIQLQLCYGVFLLVNELRFCSSTKFFIS